MRMITKVKGRISVSVEIIMDLIKWNDVISALEDTSLGGLEEFHSTLKLSIDNKTEEIDKVININS